MTADDYKNHALKKAQDSLQMSDEDLLREIFDLSNRGLNVNAPAQISRTLAYFSSLLIKLSRQAEKSTKRILFLTWVIVALTAVLVLTVFFEFPKITMKLFQQQSFSTENPNKNEKNKPSGTIINLPVNGQGIPNEKNIKK